MVESLIISPVFNALTKPDCIMGVNYDYFIIISLVSVLAFVFSNNLLMGLIFLPLHNLGWLLTRMDPHIFIIVSKRAMVGAVFQRKFLGYQMYEPY